MTPIKTVENQTNEEYEHGRILTNAEADEWNEYKQLDEQGLLLRLPCKAGDTVYKPNPITLSEIVEIKIESIFITESKINISGRTTKMKYSFCCSPSDFGKTVFLTQAEAEQKLKEMESVHFRKE